MAEFTYALEKRQFYGALVGNRTFLLRLFFLLCFLLMGFVVCAQAPVTKVWEKVYGGNSLESPTSIVQLSDGGLLVGGRSYSSVNGDKTEPSRGNCDYWVLKLATDGSKLWDKTLGTSGEDYLYSLVETADGGFLVSGSSFHGAVSLPNDRTEASRGDYDYWIVKLDAQGKVLWDKTFGGDKADLIRVTIATADNGFLLGGTSASGISGDKTQPNRGDDDYWVVKVDQNGNKLWDKTLGGSSQEILFTALLTPEGDYLLGGWSRSSISGEKSQDAYGYGDAWLVKLSAAGAIKWERTYGGNDYDDIRSMALAPEGGYVLGGISGSLIGRDKSEDSKGGFDYWLVKLTEDGTKEWDKTFGGEGQEELHNLLVTSDGGYLVGGGSSSTANGDRTEAFRGVTDTWLVKLRPDGSKIWDKAFGTSAGDYFGSVVEAGNGQFVVGITSSGGVEGDKVVPGKGQSDFWLIKIRDSNLLSSRYHQGNNGIEVKLFPNPTLRDVNLSVDGLAPSSAKVTLVLRNSLGQMILQQDLKADQVKNGVRLPVANVGKGVFQLQLYMADKVITKALLLQ